MLRPRAVLPTIAVGCIGAVATMLARASPAHLQPTAKPAGTPVRTAPRTPPPAPHGHDYNTTIKRRCVWCHDARTKTAGLTLESFDVAWAARNAIARRQLALDAMSTFTCRVAVRAPVSFAGTNKDV